MSVLSTLKRVVSKTNGTINNFHVGVPSFSFNKGFKIDTEEVTSLSDLVTSIENSVGTINSTANVALCALSVATDPTMSLKVLGQVMGSLEGVLADVLDTIIDAVEGQIEQAISNTVGAVFSLIEAVLTLIEQITNIFNTIYELVQSLSKLAELEWKRSLSDDECVSMMASIAACYLNKWLGPLITEFESDALSTIRSEGNRINSKIKDEFGDVDEIRYYLNQESRLLNKANTQLKSLNNIFAA